MKIALGIRPTGFPFIYPSEQADALESPHGELLREAFEAGPGKGILSLLRRNLLHGAPPPFRYFGEFGRDFIFSLCHLPESEPVASLQPAGLEFRQMEAPPMFGGEYLSLLPLWQNLAKTVQEELEKFTGSRAEWVRALNPAWGQVGKVSFHLAENKQDQSGERPFAFLATFIHKLTAGDRPKHLPLGEALKAYADNRNALLSVLKPVQQASEGSGFLKELLESRRIYTPQAWSAREAYNFLHDIPLFEEAGIIVRIANIWKSSKPARAALSINVDVAEGQKVGINAMMRCSASVCVNGQQLTPEELAMVLASHDGLVKLKGEWIEADSEKIAGLMNIWQEAQDAMLLGISFMDSLKMLSRTPRKGESFYIPEFYKTYCNIHAGDQLQMLLNDLQSPGDIPLPPLPQCLDRILRPYQLDGVRFLWRITELGLGGCLADDMGLGKTLQLLALISLWQGRGDTRRLPVLLVLPASLLRNWENEAARFTPWLRFKIIHSSALLPDEKEMLIDEPEIFLSQFDVVATTYGMVKTQAVLKKIQWTAVIADEAQALKNPLSQQSRAVRSLHSSRRLALTGTPVENNLTDLWSIFDFVLPGLLGNLREYGETIKEMKDNAEGVNYAPLRQLTRPYILRRLKTDRSIIRDLPDKSELNVYCGLARPQMLLYRKAVETLARDLKELDEKERRGLVFKYLMIFKQICNHPAQFSGNGDYNPQHGGKFKRLGEIAAEIASRQDKMLIFTQFREMTAPLDDFLTGIFGRPGLILHGGTPIKERPKLVEQFQSPDGPPYFVLSLKAAGVGLNLTAANHVVHFDRWWNPAVENQATDRAYRIGQHRNVLVHKFVCKGTIEERIHDLILSKRDLAENLLGEGAEKLLTDMSNEELLNFVALDVNSIVQEPNE